MPRILFIKSDAAAELTARAAAAIRHISGDPTPAQTAAGRYPKRAMQWQGLTIRIENEAGSYRRGRSRDGKEWEVRMVFPYGEIARTEGVDGDPVDVIVGPYLEAPMVYVVHQRRYGDWENYDEDKCCIGFDSEESATAAFLANYNDHRFLGPITAMPVAEFIAKVKATRKAPKMIKAVQMITRKDGVSQRYHVSDKPKPEDEQMLADDMEAQMQWLEAQAAELGYADIDDLVTRNYPAFEALAAKWREDHPVEVALKSFADTMLKARVGPYIRGGKMVNLRGYDGRTARTDKAPGQGSLFTELEVREAAARKVADMGRHDHTKTADLFEDAPAARVKQTETRAFKEWFGSSKVRDENGEPMRMYHITPHDFDTFHPGGKEALDGHPEGQSGRAIWFSPFNDHMPAGHNTSPSMQRRKEGAQFRDGTRVMPVYLRMERPLLIDSDEMLDWAQDVFAQGSKEFPMIVLGKWKDEIAAAGYDGIIFRGDGVGWGKKDVEYIVFDPNQVKSAIGNNGDFSKDSPVITKSILFIKAKLRGDDRTADMFGTHLEMRTRKDGVVQGYQVANAKKDKALDAAIAHLKEDARQDDMPAHEKKEDAALVAKLEEARKPAGNETAARRKAALAVLGDDWKSVPDGKKDAYKRSIKLDDGGRYEVMIKPARTVAGDFYVGSYFHGGKRSGPGNAVDHPKTLEEAKAVADGWIAGVTAPKVANVEAVKPATAEDLEKFIKVAADSIGQLRKIDVMRVLESNGIRKRELARYIAEKRPDLAQEVKEVMEEEFGIKDWQAPQSEDPEKLKAAREMVKDLIRTQREMGKPVGEHLIAKLAELDAKLGPEEKPASAPKTKQVIDMTGWSEGQKSAYALRQEYEANRLTLAENKQAMGAFKRKLRAVAKTIPEDDEKAVMQIDGLATKVWGSDYNPKVADVEFGPSSAKRDGQADYKAAVRSTKKGPEDDNPRRKFYVTIAREGRGVSLLAGPFDTHDEALAMVDRAKEKAYEVDPRSHFDAFGTSGVESDNHKPGVLNDMLGIGKPAAPTAVTVANKKKVRDPLSGTETHVTLSNGKTHRLQRLNATESMGLPGWHDVDGGYLADSEQGAIDEIVRRASKTAPDAHLDMVRYLGGDRDKDIRDLARFIDEYGQSDSDSPAYRQVRNAAAAINHLFSTGRLSGTPALDAMRDYQGEKARKLLSDIAKVGADGSMQDMIDSFNAMIRRAPMVKSINRLR